METRDILTYLEFLDQHATNMLSKTKQEDDCLRSINIEVNKFVERLKQSQKTDESLITDICKLKVPFDENKRPGRSWSPYILFWEFLSFIPGFTLVCGMEKEDQANQRITMLQDFIGGVRKLKNAYEGVIVNEPANASQKQSFEPRKTTLSFLVRLIIFLIIFLIIILLLTIGD